MQACVFPIAVAESRLASNADALLAKQTLQIGLSEAKTVEFAPGGHVILDFGKEMGGGHCDDEGILRRHAGPGRHHLLGGF